MSELPALYTSSEPLSFGVHEAVPSVHTAVVARTDMPMYTMATLMDGAFAHLAELLTTAGSPPAGGALALHHRMPVDTADVEVGFPVAEPLAEPILKESGHRVTASTLPSGRVAAVSHLGGYDGLADAWGAFIEQIGEAGEQMAFPFWEIYVTEPSPGAYPASLRTDLFTVLAGD